MGEFILNSIPGATVVGALLIIMDTLYLKHTMSDVKSLDNLGQAIVVAIVSFLECLYMSIFFAGRVSEKNVQVMFFSAGGFLLTIIAIITFTALLLSARKQIKEGTISKETAQKTYLGSNAALGFGMAYYMFGVIFLILSGLKVFIMPLTDMIPQGFVGGTAALILSVGWVFVLPMYLIGKTPEWLKEILNRF